eukprot:4501689-Prymnesium_polylepis.1
MCPLRPHGVTGLARGDMYERLRAAWGGRGGWECGTSRRHMLLPMPCGVCCRSFSPRLGRARSRVYLRARG